MRHHMVRVMRVATLALQQQVSTPLLRVAVSLRADPDDALQMPTCYC